jgi:hypothetical protein
MEAHAERLVAVVEGLEVAFRRCASHGVHVAHAMPAASYLRHEFLPALSAEQLARLQATHRARLRRRIRSLHAWERWAWACFVGSGMGIADALAASTESAQRALVDYLAARVISTTLRAFVGLRAAVEVLERSGGGAVGEVEEVEVGGVELAPAVGLASRAAVQSALQWRRGMKTASYTPTPLPTPALPETLRLTVTLLQCNVGFAKPELERLVKALVLASRALKPPPSLPPPFTFPPVPEIADAPPP